MELSKKDQATLHMITKATAEQGFMYIAEKLVKKLVDNELVEVNNEMKDEAGNPAVRAVVKEVVVVVQQNEQNQIQQGNKEMSEVKQNLKFELSSNIAIPAASRRASPSRSVYPFEQMEKGQSFFIADADKPIKGKDGSVTYDAFVGMTSVLSSANERYKEPTGNKIVATKGRYAGKEVEEKVSVKKFVQRVVVENGVKGTRVWREL
jgi:hypothetical protein